MAGRSSDDGEPALRSLCLTVPLHLTSTIVYTYPWWILTAAPTFRTVQANKSKQKKIKRAPFPSVDLNRLASLFCRTLDILYAPGVASRASLSDGCRALGEW